MFTGSPTKEDRDIYASQTEGMTDKHFVAALVHHDSYSQSTSIASTLPEIAGYNGKITVVQMVKNRINGRTKMRLDKDLVI